MVFRSERKSLYAVAMLFACVTIASLIIYLDSGQLAIPAIIFIPSIIVCFLQLIAVGRKIEMDRHGIVISFLGYKKSYRWDELKTKVVVDYKGSLGYRDNHIRGAEFSPRAPRKRRILKSAEYCTLVAPFSFVFIYFNVEGPTSEEKRYPKLYPADEKTFLKKMNSWRITLQGQGDGFA